VQLTAGVELKRKLELARDLLRHAVPDGDLATLVERALDLLLEHTMKRRFGLKTRASRKASFTPSASRRSDDGVRKTETHVDQHASSPSTSRHIPNEVRRTVLCRDGLRCAWVGPDGTRCTSRAWLEHDHAIPRGQGGDNNPANIRPFCRAHNQLAAELAYGRDTIARILARQRTRRRRPPAAAPRANDST
jgi:5-methylcytosine-specific restriction endonuclease McrA